MSLNPRLTNNQTTIKTSLIEQKQTTDGITTTASYTLDDQLIVYGDK